MRSRAPLVLTVGKVYSKTLATGIVVGRGLLKRLGPGRTRTIVVGAGVHGRVELQGTLECETDKTTVLARKARSDKERDKVVITSQASGTYMLAMDAETPKVEYVWVPGYPQPITAEENKVENPVMYGSGGPFGSVSYDILTIAIATDGGVMCPFVRTGFVESVRRATGVALGHDPIDFYRRELMDKDGAVVTGVVGREPADGDHYGVHRYSRSFAQPGEVSLAVHRGPPGRVFAVFVSYDGGTKQSYPEGIYTYQTKKLRVVEVSANSVITGEVESEFSISGYYDYRYARDGRSGETEFIMAVSSATSYYPSGLPKTEYSGAGVLYVNRELVLDASPLPLYVLPGFQPEYTAVMYRADKDSMVVRTVTDWATDENGRLYAGAWRLYQYVFDRQVQALTEPDDSSVRLYGAYCFGRDSYARVDTPYDNNSLLNYSATILGSSYSGTLDRESTNTNISAMRRVRVIEYDKEDAEKIVERPAILFALPYLDGVIAYGRLHYGDVGEQVEVVDMAGATTDNEAYAVCAATTDSVLQTMRAKNTAYTITTEVDRTVTPAVIREVVTAIPAIPVGLIDEAVTGKIYINITTKFPTTEYN